MTNGKRASLTGPAAVIKEGMVLLLVTIPSLITWLSGLAPMKGYWFAFGLLPPTAGCEWHAEHWLRLKRGPRPLLVPPETTSTCSNRVWPFAKNSGAPAVAAKSGSGVPAFTPVLLRTPGSV